MEKYPTLLAAILFSSFVSGPLVVGAEPIVVLQYPGSGMSDEDSDAKTHPFRMNPNYATKHKVRPDETLSHVITNYYGGSGIDSSFVQMAIVRVNKQAFVRSNPNYLYADSTLHLPSLNEIRSMITGGVKTSKTDGMSGSDGYVRNEIFFFGG